MSKLDFENQPQTEPVDTPQPETEAPEAPRKRKHKKSRKTDQILRIEKLEKLLADEDTEVDPEALVSMYLPHRRAKSLGNALLRLDKMRLSLLLILLAVMALFILAFMQEKMGNFTINLNRLELYRRGIAISADGEFKKPTARLTAYSVEDATNITLEDLPKDIDEIEGDHNGLNYMAYTYFIRNAGKEDVGYQAAITLDACAKGAEQAVRVVVWRNGERTVYAAPAADGNPEPGCVSFLDNNLVCTYTEENFLVGNVDKYTIVIFMEGEDPECVDAIVGGSVEFSMGINALEEDDTSLLWKFVTDIKDTLTGNKSIGAAGEDAPNYYFTGDLTWENRRNQ